MKLLGRSGNQVKQHVPVRLIGKVMVADEHLVLGHRLDNLLSYIDEERDGILLCVTCHRYME